MQMRIIARRVEAANVGAWSRIAKGTLMGDTKTGIPETWCSRRVQRRGRMVRCGHCEGCRTAKYRKWLRKAEAGLEHPGHYVFVKLVSPHFFPGVRRHIAPPIPDALGRNRRLYERLWGVRCPCGEWHEAGHALMGVPLNHFVDWRSMAWMEFADCRTVKKGRVGRRLRDFDGLAAFNLLLGKLVNATLTKVRKLYPGVQCFYVKRLSNWLSGQVLMLVRMPRGCPADYGEIGRLMADTCLSKYDIGWGRLADCRPVDAAEARRLVGRMLDVVLHGVGGNATGTDGKARAAAHARYRDMVDTVEDAFLCDEAEKDLAWELNRIEKDAAELRAYRATVLFALRLCVLHDEVIPRASCPVHRGFDSCPWWKRDPLQRAKGCTCVANSMYAAKTSIANFGLGSHLVGCTRGWSCTVSAVQSADDSSDRKVDSSDQRSDSSDQKEGSSEPRVQGVTGGTFTEIVRQLWADAVSAWEEAVKPIPRLTVGTVEAAGERRRPPSIARRMNENRGNAAEYPPRAEGGENRRGRVSEGEPESERRREWQSRHAGALVR